MKDNEYETTEYPGTTAGLQAAIDHLAGGKGKVFIGPGTLEVDDPVSIHQGCHLQGSGMGVTVIKRASGSISAADPEYTGSNIITTAVGANGTLYATVATQLEDITISDLTLDGNRTAFTAIDTGTPRHFGINAQLVDNLRILNVEIKNFEQSGIYTSSCNYVHMRGLLIENVGKATQLYSCNGITCTRNLGATSSTRYGGIVIDNCVIRDVKDETIAIKNADNVVISNIYSEDIGDRFLEYNADTTSPTSDVQPMRGLSVTNCVCKDFGTDAMTFVLGDGTDECSLEDVAISGCVFVGTAGTNEGAAILLPDDNKSLVKNVHVSNCVFLNMNGANTAARHFVQAEADDGYKSENITISNCLFHSDGSMATDPSLHGMFFGGDIEGLTVEGCTLLNSRGRGILVQPQGTRTMKRLAFRNNWIVGCTNDGIEIASNNGAGGTIRGLDISGNYIVDSNQVTAGNAIQVIANQASSSVTKVRVSNNTAYLEGAFSLSFGLSLDQGSTGVLDNVIIEGNDFAGATSPMTSSGAPTNIHFTPVNGKGSNITAAATITIPANGDVFHVTGSTNITNGITVKPWDNGRTVKLIFDSTPTVSDTGTSVLQGDFTAAANDVLCLVCDGTNWYEVSRN